MKRLIRAIHVVALAAALTMPIALAGDLEVDGKLISTASTGSPIEVSSSQLVTGLNADLLDGLSASDLAPSVHNLIVAAKSGGQFSSIQAAIDSITDAAEDNRYLVWIGPGIYDEEVNVGSQWIALEGAGRHSTIVRSDGNPGTIIGASIVRDLTVEASGDGDAVRGIWVCPTCQADLSHLTVDVTTSTPTPGIEVGASGILCAPCVSLDISHSAVSVASTNANGFNFGIYGAATSSLSLSHVETTAYQGLSANAVIASADGIGLEAHEPALFIESLEAHAWDGSSENVGAYLQGDVSNKPPLRISRTTATAKGSSPTGLTVEYGEATLDNVVARAENGASQLASLFHDGNFEVFQSRFVSPSPAGFGLGMAISASATATLSLAYSQIVGSIDSNASGQFTCYGIYDGAFSDFTCPP